MPRDTKETASKQNLQDIGTGKSPWIPRIRWRVGVVILLVVLAAFLLHSVIRTTLPRFSAEADRASRRATEWVRTVAAQQHGTLVETQQYLQTIAGLTSLPNIDPRRCKAVIASQAERHANYSNVGLMRPDGQVQCSAHPLAMTVAQGISLSDEARRSGLGLLPIADTGELLFAVPVRGKPGTPVPSVVFAVRTLPGLEGRSAVRAGDLAVEFFTRSGLILAHNPGGERLVGRTLPDIPLIGRAAELGAGIGDLAGPDGVNRLYAFVPVEGPGAERRYLAAGLPLAAVHAETRRLLYAQCAALLVLLAAALAVLASIGRDRILARPLAALARPPKWLRRVRAFWHGRRARLLPAGFMKSATLPLRWRLKPAGRALAGKPSKSELTQIIASLQRTAGDMDKLNDMSRLLQTCVASEEFYGVVARFAQELFPGERGALFLISASRNLVEAAVTWGEPPGKHETFMLDDCWAVRLGKTHGSEDPHADPQCAHVVTFPPGGYLCVPMFVRGEVLGIFHLQHESPPAAQAKKPADKDKPGSQLAQAFAERTALALSNLQLRESLRAQSIRDPLTGLYNRRFLNEAMEIETHRAKRSGTPIGVIMIDIDHFKRFNDTFGHAAGDALLRELGQFLHEQMREEDIACRYGGEEFIVILPGAPLDVSRERAETLRSGVGGLTFDYQGTQLGPITLSLGVACCSAGGSPWQQTVKAADAALYRAKEEGRNRVGVAEEESQS